MAQTVQPNYAIPPTGVSGTQLAEDLNKLKDSLLGTHSGVSRPAYLTEGGLWLEVPVSGNNKLNYFDGADNIVICEFDAVTNKIVLGDYYTKTEADDNYLQVLNDLSDLNDVIAARTNLDVYSTGEIDSLFVNGVSGGAYTIALTSDYNIMPANGLLQVLQPDADGYTALLPLGTDTGINVIVFNDSLFELFVESTETTTTNSTVKILPKGKFAFGWSGTEWVSHKYENTGLTMGDAIKEYSGVDDTSLDNIISNQSGYGDKFLLLTVGAPNTGNLAYKVDVLIGKVDVNNQTSFNLNTVTNTDNYILNNGANEIRSEEIITRLTNDRVLIHYKYTDLTTSITEYETAIGSILTNVLSVGSFTDLTPELIGDKAIRINDDKFMFYDATKLLIATEAVKAITLGVSQVEASVADYITLTTDKIVKASSTGLSLGSVSGTTVSFGAEVSLSGVEKLYKTDTDKFVAVYDDVGTKKMIVGLISGTDILTGTAHSLASTFEDLVALSPTRFVVRHTTSTIENFGIGGTSISSVASTVLPLPSLLGGDLVITMEKLSTDTLLITAPKKPLRGRYTIADGAVYIVSADATKIEIREGVRKTAIDVSNSLNSVNLKVLPAGLLSPTTKNRVFIGSEYYEISTVNVGEITV
jgi:hypothetical protein